jgi:hypothetical protein
MKKLIFFFYFFTLLISANAQTESIRIQLQNLTRKTVPSTKIYINVQSQILEIDSKYGSYQIPYNKVLTLYKINNDIKVIPFKHSVNFNCKNDESCIYQTEDDKYIIGLTIPILTKDDCYKFINLISKL